MEAIKYYVKGAFVGIPETPEVLEQQEELISDLSAKVEDLAAEGKTEDEALGIAIASMGDLSALVREFAVEEPVTVTQPAEPPVPTAEVYTSKLRLHAVILSACGAIALLFVLSVMTVVSGNTVVAAWIAMIDLLLGIAGIVWMGYTLFKFHGAPNEKGALELRWQPLKTALTRWAVVCAFVFFVNLLLGTDGFWAWTVWIGALAWPASIYMEQKLVRAGKFLVTPPVCESEACSTGALGRDDVCAPSCS